MTFKGKMVLLHQNYIPFLKLSRDVGIREFVVINKISSRTYNTAGRPASWYDRSKNQTYSKNNKTSNINNLASRDGGQYRYASFSAGNPSYSRYHRQRDIRTTSATPIQTNNNNNDFRRDASIESVVKIYVTSVSPNYLQPWSVKLQKESFGSGFCISDRRILTNAHVVANATSVMIRAHSSSKKYQAKIAHIGHECDLAVLKVDDDDFWKDMSYLELDSDVPLLQDKVSVIGYPSGGDTISLSQGVVSRIELQQYTHGNLNLLAIQIDAAINPGNSGGPAIKNGKVVGVAFQHIPGAENMGHVIPVSIIDHFLHDIARHGHYTGFCYFGVKCQSTENRGLRKFFGLDDCPLDGGIRVMQTYPVHEASQVLKTDDIIMKIDGKCIGSDGTVPYRNQRILFDFLLVNKYINDSVNMVIWRDGQLQEVIFKLGTFKPLVPYTEYSKSPSYLVYAGLVFQPLVQPYLREWGYEWQNTAPRRLTHISNYGVREFIDEEVVIISNVLVHEINQDYQFVANNKVLGVNGTKILNLKHLKQEIENSSERYIRLDLDQKLVICLDRKAASEANKAILESHLISSDHRM